MATIISLIVGLVLVATYPMLWFLIIGLMVARVIITKPNYFNFLSKAFSPATKTQDATSDISVEAVDKGFITYEERQQREVDRTVFKEGFQDDPKWKEQVAALQKQVQRAEEREYDIREGIERSGIKAE